MFGYLHFGISYSKLNFVHPGKVVENLYASYSVGCYDGDMNKNKINWRLLPLQKVCTDTLGLEYKEVVPELNFKNRGRRIKDKYVTISEHSTFACKYWHNLSGWQDIIDYLNELDLKVMVISKEKTKLKNIIDRTDRTIEESMNNIYHSEFLIGVSSGPAWLAWALKVPVIMISGYSKAIGEFHTGVERIINTNVCHGCFNRTDLAFDRGDWNWCPVHKGTPRQFECTKQITPEMVKEAINKIIRKN
jgi:autotransporter strand-loop-strand O-heptosyltransferase